jgi:hypothetical protein
MLINDDDTNGFNINIKTISIEDYNMETAETFSARNLGGQIIQFINSMLSPGQVLHIAVSAEKWDKTYVLEESVYRIVLPEKIEEHAHYSRNYWIETKNN